MRLDPSLRFLNRIRSIWLSKAWNAAVRSVGILAVLWIVLAHHFASADNGSAETRIDEASAHLIKTYCIECHGAGHPEAHLDLSKMVDSVVVDGFKDWRKVASVLESDKMPPRDAKLPRPDERNQLLSSVRRAIDATTRMHANDPGDVILRRLTSAEYAYSVRDLTGLDLGIERDFVSDAVGGEGFTNVGTSQFVQDSTLERYLEAAKKIADHAIIGAGPLQFYPDPGQTGLELSAINRIKNIYREHGFRIAAGENAEPFGLDRFPKAFYVAWQFRYRNALGLGEVDLSSLAKNEGLEDRFADHIWTVLNESNSPFPLSEIVKQWKSLPSPAEMENASEAVRKKCDELNQTMLEWQQRFASSSSAEEEASVFYDGDFVVTSDKSFIARVQRARGGVRGARVGQPGVRGGLAGARAGRGQSGAQRGGQRGGESPANPSVPMNSNPLPTTGTSDVQPGGASPVGLNAPVLNEASATLPVVDPTALIRIRVSVEPASFTSSSATVIWRNPRIVFRRLEGIQPDPEPLQKVISGKLVNEFQFGSNPGGDEIGPGDFILRMGESKTIELTLPEESRQAELLVDVQLDSRLGRGSVARCVITDATAPRGRVYSAMIADIKSDSFVQWKKGIAHFARSFPQISHREPTPSDRDPIPLPFDNTYNKSERNFFHTAVKYSRDDRFVVEHLLDSDSIRNLDRAWTDVLTSFDFHDVNLKFLAKKYHFDLEGRTAATLDSDWVAQLPVEPRLYVQALSNQYQQMQRELFGAQSVHLSDAMRFASRAWRRPLTESEQSSLRSFYETKKQNHGLGHVSAVRALIARILVAPEFLYRIEHSDRSKASAPLSNQEIANRLSYFLWSSVPDDELSAAAQRGELSDVQNIELHARRLLKDEKSQRLATEFFGQWFGFYQFDRFRGVDLNRFPEFDDALRSSMYAQAIAFFEHIVRHDRPVTDIIHADYTFLDARLATHYGINGKGLGDALELRTDGISELHRGGLFGLGAVLTSTSAPLRTSPVKRGDWILRRVIGTPVPPPPADAGSIPADDVQPDGQTVRARLESHRTQATCANCHIRIDPPGFALENFDSLGRWRSEYRDGQKIDTSGILENGSAIAGPTGLRDYLKENESQFRRTLCAKLAGYALGRAESVADALLVDNATAVLERDPSFSSVVVAIVTSPQFRNHRGSSE